MQLVCCIVVVAGWWGVGCAQAPAPQPWPQRAGDFKVVGPGGGGATYAPSISPVDPRIVLVRCDMSGAYVTHDGGKSWWMFNLRTAVTQFAFDPQDRDVFYAVANGLWQTKDGGVTWRLLWPTPGEVRGVENNGDHGEVSLVGKWPLGTVSAVAVDPRNGEQLWITADSGSSHDLYRSEDGGGRWKKVAGFPSSIQRMTLAGGALWLCGPQGFWRWEGEKMYAPSVSKTDGYWDETWADVDGTGAKANVTLMGIHDGKLYVSKAARGEDHSWVLAKIPGDGTPKDKVRVVTATGGHDGKTFYASVEDLTSELEPFLGLAKTTDGGATWNFLWKGVFRKPMRLGDLWPNMDAGGEIAALKDGWIASSLGPAWGAFWLGLTVSTVDPELLYATDFGRTMKSTDGGRHWESVYSRTLPGGGAVSTGLDVETSWGVFWDPFDAKRMFIAYTDIGLMRSEDGGESWVASEKGVPPRWFNTTYWVVFDPEVRNKMWAAVSYVHDLPRPKMWRNQSLKDFVGGVLVSTDGGRTWSPSSEGMPPGAVTHLVMDPASHAGKRTLWAAVAGRGVYCSQDDGRTWTAKNEGIEQPDPLAYRLALGSDGDLYVAVARRAERGFGDKMSLGAVYRRKAGTEQWKELPLPAEANGVEGVTVDPRDPSRLYVAVWPMPSGANGVGGGIYLSTDKGEHWQRVFRENQHIFDVTYNPKKPEEMYATGFESSAWISEDRGEHWRRIAGYDFLWGQRIMADQERPGWVYINTFGGGVWHGRVDGKPGVESIATPEVMPAGSGR